MGTGRKWGQAEKETGTFYESAHVPLLMHYGEATCVDSIAHFRLYFPNRFPCPTSLKRNGDKRNGDILH